MRFFTPDLFVQYNSSNDDVADRADEAWEAAVQQYQAHLAKLRALMPTQVKKLADFCLHDAEVLAYDRAVETSSTLSMIGLLAAPGLAIVSVKQENAIVSLFYRLWDEPRRHQYKGNWPFSKQRPHWLYDEIDVSPFTDAMFLHRILFSDGIILEIPFESVLVHTVPMQSIDDPAWSKQIA